jgi:hypothetical protein
MHLLSFPHLLMITSMIFERGYVSPAAQAETHEDQLASPKAFLADLRISCHSADPAVAKVQTERVFQ